MTKLHLDRAAAGELVAAISLRAEAERPACFTANTPDADLNAAVTAAGTVTACAVTAALARLGEHASAGRQALAIYDQVEQLLATNSRAAQNRLTP